MREVFFEDDENQELLRSLREDGVGVIIIPEEELRNEGGWGKEDDLVLGWINNHGVLIPELMKPEFVEARILGVQHPEAGDMSGLASIIVARR